MKKLYFVLKKEFFWRKYVFFAKIICIYICVFNFFNISYANPCFLQEKHFIKINIEDNNARLSYALGMLLGNDINHSFKEQKKLGVTLYKDKILIGIQDSLSENSILSEKEVSKELIKLENKLKHSEEMLIKRKIHDNKIKGEHYIKNILTKKNFRCTSSGLVFHIEKKGKGNLLKNSDFVTVNYKGLLIDGKEFDSTYKYGSPLSFCLDGVIPGWNEGLKYIRKGGKIKLILPPKLGYGDISVPGILGGSTLIFEIELIDVKSK